MQKIIRHKSCTSYEVFIGGYYNFRYELYPEYKGNRDPKSKPIHEEELRKYLVARWDAQIVDGEEVDDRVSILQSTMDEETCIVTIDKDLDNTAGWHFNYDKDDMYLVTPADADLNFYRQLITGDKTVDNIPGLPRKGKVAAAKALPEALPIDDMCKVVWDMYQELEFGRNYFIMNGQLLWMRREDDEYWQAPIDR